MDTILYESLKKQKKQLECDKCGFVWMVDETGIYKSTVVNENGQEMIVQFFLCPQCHEVFVINIIDYKARTYIERIKKMDKRIHRIAKSGGNPNDDVTKRNQVAQSMMAYQKMLKNKYSKYLHLRFEEATTSSKVEKESKGEKR